MPLSLKRYRSLLVTYLRPQWQRVLLLLLLLFCNIGLSLVNPQILSQFIDAIGAAVSVGTLLWIALLYLGLAILRQLATIAETYEAENVSLTATNALRADLTLHCLRLDPAFHASHSPGELIERINNDVGSLGNFFSRFVISLLGNLLLLVGILVMFFRIEWRVGLAMAIFALLSMVFIARSGGLATHLWEAERQASAELSSFIEERISGTEDIRSSGATSYMVRGLAERARAQLSCMLAALRVNFISWGSIGVLTAIGTALSLALGGYLFSQHTITIGTVYLIYNYTTLLNTPIEQIVNQLRDIQQSAGSMTRIFGLLDTRSTIEDGHGEPIPPGPLLVDIQDLSFQYVEDVPVLQHIKLALAPGKVLGLLGRTGSGKTTLTRLLLRMYDPQQGQISLNGVDLRAMHLDELYERIGIVTQDVQILHTTVRNNLALFNPTITDARVIEALEILGLDGWYHSLPQGLDTQLVPGGSGLSAGESQLLAFARVFLKDPSLVILDEASSRLDPATERRLEQAITRLLEGRTAIIIAHHLATVQRADMILILEGGRCREYGPREALSRDPNSRFSQLMRTGLEEVLL